jgi:SAM-dependent methyltransferase
MKAALKSKAPPYPQGWDDLPRGKAFKQAIEAQCDDNSRMFFGYHLVKLGSLSCSIDLPNCPINHIVCVTAEQQKEASLVSQSNELPMVESSVDAFLLCNELDFAADPHQILREIERVITPNGYLMLTGFNPLSFAGFLRFVPLKRLGFLKQARFFTASRVKDWLQLLGFEIIEQRKFAHFSLLSERQNKVMGWLYEKCARYIPWTGAMYVIVARKREIPLSLIKPSWRLKPKFSTVGASARASTRTSVGRVT